MNEPAGPHVPSARWRSDGLVKRDERIGEGRTSGQRPPVLPLSAGPAASIRSVTPRAERLGSKPAQLFGLSGLPMLMGGGGLKFEPEKGEGVALGGCDSGAVGGPPGDDGAGAADPDDGDEYTADGAGAPAGIAGPTPIVGIMPYPPGGSIGAEPQLPPTQGMGKSSQVSHWVHPTAPAAQATTTTKRMIRPIAVSFPYTAGSCFDRLKPARGRPGSGRPCTLSRQSGLCLIHAGDGR